MTSVATNLLGRYVKGTWFFHNPKYVYPESGFGEHSKKEKAKLTKDQMEYWSFKKICDQIVAVTCEGEAEYKKLIFWVLYDGKPVALHENATVMPAGWVPEIR